MANKEVNTIWAHLNELRRRLIICIIAIAVGIIISFVFADQLFKILVWPAKGVNLIFIDVTEMLGTYMQVCLAAAIIVLMPALVYQLNNYANFRSCEPDTGSGTFDRSV